MSDSAKQAWSEVGEKFSSWGRRLTEKYHEAGPTERTDETERELKRAAKELVDELSKGVSALADTIRDDQAKKELSDALTAMGNAITATVNEATDAIRSKGGTPPPPPPPPAG
jgi:DNA-binding ferritin-like protein